MRVAVLLAVAIVLSSCDSIQPPEGLNGAWAWVESGDGIRSTTPEAAGYTITLTLEDGTFKLQRNGAVVQTSRYSWVGTEGDRPMLRFREIPDAPVFTGLSEDTYIVNLSVTSQGDRLGLQRRCLSCTTHHFERAGN